MKARSQFGWHHDKEPSAFADPYRAAWLPQQTFCGVAVSRTRIAFVTLAPLSGASRGKMASGGLPTRELRIGQCDMRPINLQRPLPEAVWHLGTAVRRITRECGVARCCVSAPLASASSRLLPLTTIEATSLEVGDPQIDWLPAASVSDWLRTTNPDLPKILCEDAGISALLEWAIAVAAVAASRALALPTEGAQR